MTNLFFDIETVPIYSSSEEFFNILEKIKKGEINKDNNKVEFYKFQNGALNPYEGKIIAIAYQINNNELNILKEWEKEGSEKTILQKFFNIIDTESKKGWETGKPLTLVGFNISKFDVPFLFERMKINKIISSQFSGHDPIWLFKRLFAFHVDLLQLHLYLNNFDGKGITHDTIAKVYGFPQKNIDGSKLAEFYYGKDYEKILEYIKREFIYPQLFEKINSKGLISKEELSKLIQDGRN